jgi:MoaA/NifB/PqqE/SkfB family radical SAM enzyme
MNNINEKIICPAVWDHLCVNTNGHNRLCCNSKTRDSDTFLYNLDNHWNKYRLDIKQQMLAGIKPKECNSCWDKEKNNITSLRETLVERYKFYNWWDDFVNSINIHKKYPTEWDLKLGNFCNLSCRMCNSYSSSKYATELKKIYKETGYDYGIDPNERYFEQLEWYNSDLFYDIFKKSVDNGLKAIKFTGGEPLMVPNVKKMIDYCIKTNVAKNVELKIITNATLLDDEWVDKFKNFKDVILNCSVDGVGDIFEYIRHPASWDTVYKNLNNLKEIKTKNIVFTISFTMQIYNILQLQKMIMLRRELNAQTVNVIPLSEPNYFDAKNAPLFLKKQAIEQIDGIVTKNHFEERFVNNARSKINQQADSNVNQLYSKLVSITELKDKYKNQDIYSTELGEVFLKIKQIAENVDTNTKKIGKTFCVLPWTHIATNSNGNLRVCCNSVSGKNLIRKPNDEPYKIYKKGEVVEAWNSDYYKNLRKQFLNDEVPDICTRCFDLEKNGVKSPRNGWNENYYDENALYEENAPFKIKYVDIRLGNLCNLKCRMCNPYSSNQWVKEWKLLEKDFLDTELDRLEQLNWPEKSALWDNLKLVANDVVMIYLTGGEPTIIKEQHKLLDYFLDNNLAKNVKLKYNTNLTNIPHHLLDKWKKFKNVQVNCSIDAIGSLDRYIRYPSDWNTIAENFQIVKNLENCTIEVHCTVQMYNIMRLYEILDWTMQQRTKIYLNVLHHPDYLSVKVLPNEFKKIISKKLQEFTYIKTVPGLINYINSDDWYNSLFQKFVKKTKIIDFERNQNFLDHVPEFEQYFKTETL